MPQTRRGDRGRAAGASNGRPRAVAQALSRRPLLRTPATGVSSHKELLAKPAGDDRTAAQIRAGKAPGGQPSFDQTKPWGRGQEAPLTPQYQKVLDDSIADQAEGGQGNNFDRARCMPTGMPHMMTFGPLEFVVTPATTYILIGTQARRIFTDGRDWPKEIDPSYAGYSIGRWIDEDGDGRMDVLEVETRGFKGNRVYDITAFRCIATTARCSRNASSSTRVIPTFSMTKSR